VGQYPYNKLTGRTSSTGRQQTALELAVVRFSKTNHEPYKLKWYNVSVDSVDQVWDCRRTRYIKIQFGWRMKKMSARNTKTWRCLWKRFYRWVYKAKGTPLQNRDTVVSNYAGSGACHSIGYPSTKWWRFATATSWNVWKLGFDSLTIAQYELKVVPIHDVVAVGVCRRILKWLRVGWALRNISNELFIVWVIFSAQDKAFVYSNIRDDLWNRWNTFNMNDPSGLTKRSIMHWSKTTRQNCIARSENAALIAI
jgi:hypothetical protein